jgi:hypothetical protein
MRPLADIEKKDQKGHPALFLSFRTGTQASANLVFMYLWVGSRIDTFGPSGAGPFFAPQSQIVEGAEGTKHRRKHAEGKEGPVNRRRHDFDDRHAGCFKFRTLEDGSERAIR